MARKRKRSKRRRNPEYSDAVADIVMDLLRS